MKSKWGPEFEGVINGFYDHINHPSHYVDGGMEMIDYIESKKLGYHLGNVVKYVSRAGKKGRIIDDLLKAQWYLNRYIKQIQEEQHEELESK